ncbi:MAG: serine O-acetyltransferase [Anaerolineae bacterium]|nr:serine O-acetyltransferase [Anaerolineae bacterium]
MGLLATIREDVNCILERDPAAQHRLEVITSYAGLHAIWLHRLSHWLWTHRLRLVGRWVSQVSRFFTGVEIHPGAQIGPRFFIDHGMGVVIGETTEIGADVTIYHGVTLGGVSLQGGKRHPTLEDGVVIGAGAKVLGAITVGKNSRIGSNAVVVKDVEPGMVVVGVPGKPVKREGPAPEAGRDLAHNVMPDVVAQRLDRILDRLDEMERAIHLHNGDHHTGNGNGAGAPRDNGDGQIEVEDGFSDFYEMDYTI